MSEQEAAETKHQPSTVEAAWIKSEGGGDADDNDGGGGEWMVTPSTESNGEDAASVAEVLAAAALAMKP